MCILPGKNEIDRLMSNTVTLLVSKTAHKMEDAHLKEGIIVDLDDLAVGAARDLALNHLNCNNNQDLDD